MGGCWIQTVKKKIVRTSPEDSCNLQTVLSHSSQRKGWSVNKHYDQINHFDQPGWQLLQDYHWPCSGGNSGRTWNQQIILLAAVSFVFVCLFHLYVFCICISWYINIRRRKTNLLRWKPEIHLSTSLSGVTFDLGFITVWITPYDVYKCICFLHTLMLNSTNKSTLQIFKTLESAHLWFALAVWVFSWKLKNAA